VPIISPKIVSASVRVACVPVGSRREAMVVDDDQFVAEHVSGGGGAACDLVE
jgi:hypothetical protein